VANVGDDAFELTVRALDLPGVDRSRLRRVPESNNHVFLTYHDSANRDEVLHGMVPPVTLDHLREVAEVDMVLVNLTSGRDVLLPTLQAFRAEYAGTIQLDVHSLTLGFDAQGKRVLELPVEWPQWMACVDWVQMNEVEADLLRGQRSLPAFVQEVTALGPQGVLVTLGNRGCLVGVRRAESLHLERHAARHHPQPAFATGCGDVFGATFAWARLQGLDAVDAAGVANDVAGCKAGLESADEVLRLRRHAGSDIERWLVSRPFP
jgi:sugar/nucleoside kinase (ribokinase family)